MRQKPTYKKDKKMFSTDSRTEIMEERSWNVLFNRGYTWNEHEVVEIFHIKNSCRQLLPATDMKQNVDIATGRIIVKKWFGRLVVLWRTFKQHRWSVEKYDDLFTVCAVSINYQINHYSLRNRVIDISKTIETALRCFSYQLESVRCHDSRWTKGKCWTLLLTAKCCTKGKEKGKRERENEREQCNGL